MSVPGLKQVAYLAGSDTGVPMLGLPPTRARGNRIEKHPKPRISIRRCRRKFTPPAGYKGLMRPPCRRIEKTG